MIGNFYGNIWNKIFKKNANNKDKNFILKGKWKKYVKKVDNYKIYSVDQRWVNNNLSVTFHHGGHGYVHEFIPKNEIWISTYHYNCICKNVRQDKKVSENYFESTLLHELTESKLMKKGIQYWKAHEIALQKEQELGLLSNPYTEKY